MIRPIAACALSAGIVAAILATGCGNQNEGSNPNGSGATTNPDGKLVLGDGTAAGMHYVGMAQCEECHATESEAWRGSHHDQAMAAATVETVLGNFDEQSLAHFGSTARFFQRDSKYIVQTEGADGTLQDFEVSWVFGVDPLQQYLVDFGDGRKQVLPFCWDSRPAAAGGQRWFHISPNEAIPAGDLLHWTKSAQTWNYMCAECHSTALTRGYDADADTFTTTYQEVNVACEACHGPGSSHVNWANSDAAKNLNAANGVDSAATSDGAQNGQIDAAAMGLRPLVDHDQAIWGLDAETLKPKRTPPRSNHAQVNTCAPCHSRRSPLTDGHTPGDEFLDDYLPSLLDPLLYHADGQIQDEVYVWGSFVQSKMHHAGVTCSDCHDSHSLQLKYEGDNLCVRCHAGPDYSAENHHQHPDTRCVDCHMPETTYMVVDPRRDHSMRVPRPDLTVAIGTPNACTHCHDDKSAQWAADAIVNSAGAINNSADHYATALHKGRVGSPGAQQALMDTIADVNQPAIARATALSLYSQQGYPGLEFLLASTPEEGGIPPLLHPDPLLRLGAAQACAGLPPELRMRVAVSLLLDDVRSIRHEAVRQILPFSVQIPSDSEVRQIFDDELKSYQQSLATTLDRPGTRLNRGLMYMDLQQLDQAEAEYRAALDLEPHYVPAAINLADLLRGLERDEEGEAVLKATLELEPGNADLLHSLGLFMIRQGNKEDAVLSLRQAVDAAPRNARYALVLGVAYESFDHKEQARAAYSQGLMSTPWDPELLLAMFRLNQDNGDVEEARDYADRFLRARPDHELAEQLRQILTTPDRSK